MNKKEGIALVQLRDYGHQVLAGRKERRRFSLVSMRRFQGDYLGVAEKGAQGQMLSGAAGIGREFLSSKRILTSRADPFARLQPARRSLSALELSCLSPNLVAPPSRALVTLSLSVALDRLSELDQD